MVSLEGMVENLQRLQTNMPKYKGKFPLVHEACERTYVTILLEMKEKYGQTREYYEYEKWFLRHKGVEHL